MNISDINVLYDMIIICKWKEDFEFLLKYFILVGIEIVISFVGFFVFVIRI